MPFDYIISIIRNIISIIRSPLGLMMIAGVITTIAFLRKPLWLVYIIVLCNQLFLTIIAENEIYLLGSHHLRPENLLFVLLIYVYIIIVGVKKKAINPPLIFPMLLLFFVPYYVTLLFTQTYFLRQVGITIKIFLLQVGLFFIFTNILYRRENAIKIIIIVTLIAGCIHTLYAILQGLKVYGILPMVPVTIRYGGSGIRAVGFLDNPNTLAKHLALTILFALSFRFLYEREKILIFFLIVPLCIGILFSLSREGLFGLMFSLVASNVILRRSKKEFGVIVLGLFLIIIIGICISPEFYNRFITIFHIRLNPGVIAIQDAAFIERTISWKEALPVIGKHLFSSSRSEFPAHFGGADNTYLRLLIDGGLISLGCFIIGLLIILYKSILIYFRSENHLKQDAALCVFRGTLALIIFAIVSDVFTASSTLFTYVVSLALLAALIDKQIYQQSLWSRKFPKHGGSDA